MPRCATCGLENPGGFRFCGACGAPLTTTTAATAQERRLVTVLFCDPVGITARSDRADPEDVGAQPGVATSSRRSVRDAVMAESGVDRRRSRIRAEDEGGGG
jgi:hypothetical protein